MHVPNKVLSVTFRHVSECEVVELILCEDLPATTVVAAWCAQDHYRGNRVPFKGIFKGVYKGSIVGFYIRGPNRQELKNCQL